MQEQVVTIKHVARRAGVSVGTVSRVLNGYRNISRDNVQRVQTAVNQLGYRKCDSARLLATRRNGTHSRTGNIGVFLPYMSSEWADHPLVASYMTGIEEACRRAGYHPLLEFMPANEMLPPRFLGDHKVDGLLVKGVHHSLELLMEAAGDIPIVGMSMYGPEANIPQVMPDNHAAGRQMASYLWKRGHRRMAFVSDDSQHMMFLHRRQGVEAFVQLQGQGCGELTVCERRRPADLIGRPEASLPDMREQVAYLWDRPVDERPTVIVAANDWMAGGIYNALADRGLRVGHDVSVVGFDNIVSLCCSSRPQLTSYAIPLKQVAYTAAKILLERIESPQQEVAAGVQMIAGELIERESVADVTATETTAM